MSRTHSLFVCWLVLGKDKQTFSCAAWTLEQLKPKGSIGTERKFESAKETCSRSARISADPTNGITWAWTSMLHLSNIPKLSARPGMMQYSPGITEAPELHPSLPRGLPVAAMSLLKPVKPGYIWISFVVPPPVLCPNSFFWPLVSPNR